MTDLCFQNRLQVYEYKLSKSEKRIAEFIENNPILSTSLSSLDLADKIHTSNSTLTRFCQKLGYRNYVEFQTLLASDMTPPQNFDSVYTTLKQYYANTLDTAAQLIRQGDVDSFIRQIKKAQKILIFGLGSSGLTASEFNMRLVQMGFTSTVMIDSFLMMVQSSQFSPQDLIIAISHSGETKNVISACKIAKSVGAQICAITQKHETSLTKLADTVLFSGDIKVNNDSLFINAQMPILFLIDLITYKLLEEKKYFENREKSLRSLRSQYN